MAGTNLTIITIEFKVVFPKRIWRPVVGYEGYYNVSSLGEVMRIKTTMGTSAGRMLRPSPVNRGYIHVGLSKNGKKWQASLHRIVATAFLGPSTLQVNHKNGNKSDNRLCNLEYVTPSENQQHALRLGLRKRIHPPHVPVPLELRRCGARNGAYTHPESVARGESHPMCKLTDDQIQTIRQLLSKGWKGVDLARSFKVSRAHISRIKLARNRI